MGRDRSEITVSLQTYACIAPTHDEAIADLDAYIERNPDAAARRDTLVVGSPAEIRARYEDLRATGVDGFTVSLMANGHIPGRVTLLGETLAPVVG